jgi:hypothetical protein
MKAMQGISLYSGVGREEGGGKGGVSGRGEKWPKHCMHIWINEIRKKILCSLLYRRYINHIHLFTFFFYPSSPVPILPLAWPILHSCLSLFGCLFVVQWDFCLGIISVHVLCLSQSSHPPLHFLTLSPILYCLTVFIVAFLCLIATQMWFIHYHSVSFIFFSSSLSLLYQSHF